MKIHVLLIFLAISLLGSCKTTPPVVVMTEPIDGEDCYPHRRTIQEFKELDAKIVLMGPRFIITTEDGKRRYQSCQLPEEFQNDGMVVIFSGIQVEILPGERRMAKPLRLISIKERKTKVE